MNNRVTLVLCLLVASLFGIEAAPRPPIEPYETATWTIPATTLDTLVQQQLGARGFELGLPASDVVFARRVCLDVLGAVPEPEAVEALVGDTSPEKRAGWIAGLFSRQEYVDYFSLKWGDLLRIKAEFPINLWPNAVQAYHRWVSVAIRDNLPYDQFARALLTGSGSNFRQPTSNFYRAVEAKNPATLAKNVALTWMGLSWESLPALVRQDFPIFFSQVGYKKTLEWKEEVVVINPSLGPLEARFPDGQAVRVEPQTDARLVFANWLLAKNNPWFARVIANRVWSWFFGRGIVDPVDDWGTSSPVGRSVVLDYLAVELVKSQYDLRTLYQIILNSRTYQQSSLSAEASLPADLAWAQPKVRRLEAEVLIDALDRIGGSGQVYVSAIPEPFTFTPPTQRTTALSDGSITSSFLMRFGRPARDTGMASERNNEVDEEQLRCLLNSTDVQRKIIQSPRLKAVFALPESQRAEQIRQLYLQILSRTPTSMEITKALNFLKASGKKEGPTDLAWALINSKEFLYQH